MVSTRLKNISQIGNLRQVGMQKKKHHLASGSFPPQKKHELCRLFLLNGLSQTSSPVPFSKFYDTILHTIMSKINDAAHMTIFGRQISWESKGTLPMPPVVNNPLRPYFLGGGIGGVPLDFHENKMVILLK